MSKFQGYTIGQLTNCSRLLMPKLKNDTTVTFGERLAQIRKAAGFTQLELANEASVSRRMIAYYEGQSERPPTSLLPDIAIALGVSTDELLGVKKVKKPGKADNRLQRRFQQIDKMEAKDKRQVMQMLDTFIENAQLKEKIRKAS